MGAGATNWFYCQDSARLEAVESRLSAGSVVSFYFDDRIRSAVYSPEVRSNLRKIVAETGEAIIGSLCEDGLRIDVGIANGPDDIEEVLSTVEPRSRVFYGVFPGRDNDGVDAVTVVLPDADGIARPHPH
jgi:hypothetical protein